MLYDRVFQSILPLNDRELCPDEELSNACKIEIIIIIIIRSLVTSLYQ